MNTWTKHKRTFLHSCAALWCYIQASSLSGRSPVKWLLNLMSVCIVLQMTRSHSNQIPAVPQSTTGPRIWSQLSVLTSSRDTKSKWFLSVHLAPVLLADMESPFCISADDRRTTVQPRSLVLQFSFFGYAWQSPGTRWPCEKAEMSFRCFRVFNRWPRIRLPSCPLIRWQCTCHPRIYHSSAPRTTL